MKIFVVSIMAGLISLLSMSASASTAVECKKKLDDARSSLVTMLGGKKDADQQKIVSATANEMSKCLAELKIAGKDSDIAELSKVYGEFKNTREKELVPLILSEKKEDNEKAKTIGTGIQKERMDKMNALFKKLQGGDL